jgi:hypothetical protein
MHWFQTTLKDSASCNHASAFEINSCFHDNGALLFRLALLITGDEQKAEASVVSAHEGIIEGRRPFRDWLVEWAKAATVRNAICNSLDEIQSFEPVYRDMLCTHEEREAQHHEAQDDDEQLRRAADLLLSIDPRVAIAELDALSRAVWVLRTGLRTSLRNCAVYLNLPQNIIAAANRRTMLWIQEQP